MPKTCKIALLTGNRADYGLLQHLIMTLHKHRGVELQLLVSGVRRSAELARRLDIIKSDSFPVAATIALPVEDDSRATMAKSLGYGVLDFTDAFMSLAPDALILLGDRSESLAAAQSAYCLGIPIAHIHGGELTAGALDDAFRHAITKMAHWHFVAAPAYAKRVKQLGEPPASIFTVGPACLDRLSDGKPMTLKALEKELGFAFGDPLVLSVLHPETAENSDPEAFGKAYAQALSQFMKKHKDATIIAFSSNNDAGASHVYQPIANLASKQLHLIPTLRPEIYFSLLHHADLLAGNSSSGILEAPLLGTVSVNIGSRQAGRQRELSIIDSGRTTKDITAAMERGLALRTKIKPRKPKKGGVATAIVATLLRQLTKPVKPKQFYDAR